jgi:hypothetical protein
MTWTPSSKFCASSAHTGWACAFILFIHHLNWHPWIAAGWFLVGALFKEFFLDLDSRLENDTLAGSSLDFLTYCFGLGIGLLTTFFPWAGLCSAITYMLALTWLDIHGFIEKWFGKGSAK